MMEVPPDDAGVARLIRDCYDQIAERYMADVTRSGPHARFDWVDRFCQQLEPASEVVDVGCGPGVPTTASLVAAGHAVMGVDLSPRQIALASRNVPGAQFTVGDVLTIDVEEASIDGVLMLYVITHVPRDRHAAVLERIHRWIRPGGSLLLTFGTKDSPAWLEEDFLGYGVNSWTNGWAPERSVSLVEGAGFTIKRADRVRSEEPSGREEWLWVLAHRE